MFLLIRQKSVRFTDRPRSSLPPVDALGSQHCWSFLTRWESEMSRHYLLKCPRPVWMLTRQIFPRTSNLLNSRFRYLFVRFVLIYISNLYLCEEEEVDLMRMVTGRGWWLREVKLRSSVTLMRCLRVFSAGALAHFMTHFL